VIVNTPAKTASIVTAAALALSVAYAGCSSGEPGRFSGRLPDRAQFNAVSPALMTRCGSLDCHGSPYRNLRLFGLYGLRLDPAHLPETKVSPESEAGQREIEANYRAIVALEPEILDEVLREGGANPERLTLIRKARGAEQHEAGKRIYPGDAADRCVLSWLRGTTDAAACANVVDEDVPK
jgi:hypothetical protein